MSAESNWNIQETAFPKNGSPREKLGFALKIALLAWSESTWQQWHYRLENDCIELYAHDPQEPDASNPDDREAFISSGACLFYLKLALRHFGSLGHLELFPDLDRPELVARIFAGFGRERDAQESALFASMSRNRTSSSALDDHPGSSATLDLLRYAAMGERAWLEFAQSEGSRQRLFSLATSVSRNNAGDRGPARHGFAGQTGSRADTTRSGTLFNRPPAGKESGWTGPFLSISVRQSESGGLTVDSEAGSASQWIAMGIIKSRTDDKSGWVAAGQAAARVLLYADLSGLSWSFLNQALRNKTAREELLTGMGRKGFPQIVIRFGSRVPLTTIPPGVLRSAASAVRA